ncbi:MAG: hypothetical protein Q9222_003555 [Ikaeria aurantiellina]
MASSSREPDASAHASIKETEPFEGSSQINSLTAPERLEQKGTANTTSMNEPKDPNHIGSSESKSGDMEVSNRNTKPLQLLDLPLDILKNIVNEVSRHSVNVSKEPVSQIYSRFDIVWPNPLSAAESRQGVDALTYVSKGSYS